MRFLAVDTVREDEHGDVTTARVLIADTHIVSVEEHPTHVGWCRIVLDHGVYDVARALDDFHWNTLD